MRNLKISLHNPKITGDERLTDRGVARIVKSRVRKLARLRGRSETEADELVALISGHSLRGRPSARRRFAPRRKPKGPLIIGELAAIPSVCQILWHELDAAAGLARR